MRIKVPQDVLEGLEEVRESGETNMFVVSAVQYWAHQFDHPATVLLLEVHPEEYVRGVFEGFSGEEETA